MDRAEVICGQTAQLLRRGGDAGKKGHCRPGKFVVIGMEFIHSTNVSYARRSKSHGKD
jgi:hypothetical protein